MKVLVLNAEIPDNPTKEHVSVFLNQLPFELHENILRFKKIEDQLRTILGKLLVKKGFAILLNKDCALSDIKISKFGRPFIDNHEDFNVSHSGKYVVCALSDYLKVGIDIESVRYQNLEDYKSAMNQKQWEEIYQSADPTKSFFRFWSMKEAALKASGKGLSINPEEIVFENNITRIDSENWYLNSVDIHPSYTTYLATNEQNFDLSIMNICM